MHRHGYVDETCSELFRSSSSTSTAASSGNAQDSPLPSGEESSSSRECSPPERAPKQRPTPERGPKPPSHPRLPTRMPRGAHRLDRTPGTSCSVSSCGSASSRSLPGTPASLSARSLQPRSPKAEWTSVEGPWPPQGLEGSLPSSASSCSSRSSSGSSAGEGSYAPAARELPRRSGNSSSSGGGAGRIAEPRCAASTPYQQAPQQRGKKAPRDASKLSNGCFCLRGGRSSCEAIEEEPPWTPSPDTDMDASSSELEKLLRKHKVEPNSTLFHDIMRWHVRVAES